MARIATVAASARVNRAQILGSSGPDIGLLETFPSLMEICQTQVATRVYLGPELLAVAEKEFFGCVANATYNCTKCAWLEDGAEDSPERQRCRVAWTELLMFCKSCLPPLAGGKTKAKRNITIIVNRLAKWRAGEQAELWKDSAGRGGGRKASAIQ